MILVLTGFGYMPFDRLVDEMNKIAATVEERVVIQKGCSDARVSHAESFRWRNHEEIDKLIEDARIVVSHAGVGTLIDCARHCKPVVLVPRTRFHGEAVDDHQMEIGDRLAAEGKVVLVTDISLLREAIAGIDKRLDAHSYASGKNRLISALNRALSQTREGTAK